MQVVDEIKARLDIVEYVGKSVALQRAGRNYRGLCPFHAEKTPSFYVFTDRQTWRCFGSCGEGGDLFTFVQKRDGIEFREALRTLADTAGVALQRENPQQRSHLDRLAGIVSAAVEFYQRQLAAEPGEAARHYLREVRGISDETVAAFRIGWAPEGWRTLRDHLLGRGYSDNDMLAAGVLVENESGGTPYDRFRSRVIIPITDERGVFVALGGRGLEGEEPKYLNSPQTDIFDKGRTLFGLTGAAAEARASGTIVVVEGYMDVIGPWQAGFRNVVATMGTSLTEHHASLLRRLARRVVLAMDPDGAGMAAAERAGSLFVSGAAPEEFGRAARQATQLSVNAEIEIRVADLPSGKDPDVLAREAPDAWKAAIDQSRPYAEYLIGRLLPTVRPDSTIEVRRAVQRLAPIIRSQPGPIERSRYVQMVARHFRVSEEPIWEEVRPRRARNAFAAETPVAHSRVPLEDKVLALLLRHADLRSFMRDMPLDLFTDATNREIYRHLKSANSLTEPDLQADPLLSEHAARLASVREPDLSPADARRKALDYIGAILRARRAERQEATAHDIARLERELGTTTLAEASLRAWNGWAPPDEAEAAIQTVMENLELGLSLHRRETTRPR